MASFKKASSHLFFFTICGYYDPVVLESRKEGKKKEGKERKGKNEGRKVGGKGKEEEQRKEGMKMVGTREGRKVGKE